MKAPHQKMKVRETLKGDKVSLKKKEKRKKRRRKKKKTGKGKDRRSGKERETEIKKLGISQQ